MIRFLIVSFSVLLLLVVLLSISLDRPSYTSPPPQTKIIESHYSEETQQLVEKVMQLERMIAGQRYERAYSLSEKIEKDISNNRELADQWVVRYLDAKGDIHFNLWHFIEARNCWEKAQSITENQEKRYFTTKLNHVDKVIDRVNRERNLQTVYQAMPGTGPAGALHGKVAVIYVFVQLGNTGSWGLKSRESALRSWESTSQWLNHWAEKYRSKATFVQRIFIVGRHPYLSRITIKDNIAARNLAGKILMYSMKELKERTPLGFLERIKQEEFADQAILLLHINDKKRSFAHCCVGPCNGRLGEFAFIFELPTAQRQQMLQYTLAHECMHLFGADDLYNIKTAREYTPRDVMNYPSRLLSTSTIEGISAYAVGLLYTKPKTPFPVNEN